MGKDEDPGFCLLGASTLLVNVTQLRSNAAAARAMEVEGVHQTRVASRRLRAALPIFRTCLKKGQFERWRRGMKGLTRALGEARDADVQIEYLRDIQERSGEDLRVGMALLLESREAHRRSLQDEVRGWLDRMDAMGLVQEMEERFAMMMERLEGGKADVRGRTSFAEGRARTLDRVKELLRLERWVAVPEAKAEHHQLRIAVKRLRYTLEAFRPLFTDGLKDEVRTLKDIQDLLGEMHDCDVWLDSIEDWKRELIDSCGHGEHEVAPGLEAIRADRSQRREELYLRFSERWRALRQQRFLESLPERFRDQGQDEGCSDGTMDVREKSLLGVVSDVHGNLDALNAVLKDARDQGVVGFLNLGDMVGGGAYPEQVVRTLSGHEFLGVVGNIDLDVLVLARSSKRPKGRAMKKAVLVAAARDLSEESLRFISSLPAELRLEVGGRRVLMVHASPLDPAEAIGPDTPDDRLMELGQVANADIVLVGHSHRAFFRDVEGVLFVNPGSVGLPVDGDPRASYAILDAGNQKVTLRRVEYDVEGAVEAVRRMGLPPEMGEALRRGIPGRMVGQEHAPVKVDWERTIGMIREVARDMNLDHTHAETVLRLADSLFMQLAPLHGLGERDRSLLMAGCLLHDVGTMEGMKGHHRSSYRLIMEMDLPSGKRTGT
jgi:putative phosphoesterase